MGELEAFSSKDPFTAFVVELRSLVASVRETRDSVIRIQTLLEPNGAVDQKFRALTQQIEEAKEALENARSEIKEDLDREIGAMLKSIRDQNRRIDTIERTRGLDSAKLMVLKNRMDRVRWWVAGGVFVLTALWWIVEQFIKVKEALR